VYGRQVSGLTVTAGTGGALAFTGGSVGLMVITSIALIITGLCLMHIVRVRGRTP
jgi:hypothetical protein